MAPKKSKPVDTTYKMRRVLVTGGTGTFGKAFVIKALADKSIERIVVYSRDELKQYEMSLTVNDPRIRYFIGDVRDRERLELALQGIDTIVHAAALKQVSTAEYNPIECIKTNILGAQNIIDAAAAKGVERVIALSTDKAANPINLYGASKLCSDKLFIAANNVLGSHKIRFAVVRYGNVVGSRGSVLPFLRGLLDEGKKEFPLTHPEMTRFFLTKDEGVEFVEDCIGRMKGGEIFVPKIPSAKISDVIAVLAPGMEQKIVGIRPGEKIHETMIPEEEGFNSLEFDTYYMVAPSIQFFDKNIDYNFNRRGERGKPVPEGFAFISNQNDMFLGPKELKKLPWVKAFLKKS